MMDYKKAGVDIEAGYKSVELMKEHVKKTMRAEVLGGLGGFSGAFSLAKIPMVFTMGMAFFVIHGNDPFAVKELAFIYLVVFVLMYITGPGKFSIDHVISSALYKKKR